MEIQVSWDMIQCPRRNLGLLDPEYEGATIVYNAGNYLPNDNCIISQRI
jgi:hypothetical protein